MPSAKEATSKASGKLAKRLRMQIQMRTIIRTIRKPKPSLLNPLRVTLRLPQPLKRHRTSHSRTRDPMRQPLSVRGTMQAITRREMVA